MTQTNMPRRDFAKNLVMLAAVAVVAYTAAHTDLSSLVSFESASQPAPAAQTRVVSVGSSGSGAPVVTYATPIPGIAQNAAEAQAQFDAVVAAGNQNPQVAVQVQPQMAPIAAQQLPTAQVRVPTAVPVEKIVVVPLANAPIVYAPGSDMRPTPLPTLVYPTPLTAGKDWMLSADGLCVRAPRNGKVYEACQTWKYAQAEAASIGDFLHTGVVLGVEVKE
jgi:hypothetical protein